METKGKAVDSVIQYQLHKDNNASDSKFNCPMVPFDLEFEVTDVIVDQDAKDADPVLNDFCSEYNINDYETVKKVTSNLTKDILLEKLLLRFKSPNDNEKIYGYINNFMGPDFLTSEDNTEYILYTCNIGAKVVEEGALFYDKLCAVNDGYFYSFIEPEQNGGSV